MFTGIVQGVRAVIGVTDKNGVRRLRLDLSDLHEGIANGASIAVNGTCLTVSAHGEKWADFDVIPETLRTTNLGAVRVGDGVNVERSARLSDEIGGHRVSGHVSGVGVVTRIVVIGGDYRVWISVPPSLMPYLLRKGFVALNGASLTIAEVERSHHEFAINLIPETLARSTFGTSHAGAELNIEVDATTQAIVDTVRSLLNDRSLRAELLSGVE